MGFSIFFKNVHLRSKVLYTGYICKIVAQEQELFNFDRFIFNFGWIHSPELNISTAFLHMRVEKMSGNINNMPVALS
jgi:hypothetical protein